jgi:hypothetical protein
MVNDIFKDDKGNTSSMRKGFLLFIYVELVFLSILAIAFILQIIRGEIDFNGIATLFGAITGGGGLAFFAKALQKRFEK